MGAREETSKRINLAERVSEDFRDSLGVVLTGSVAYSPNFNVTPKSDIDLLVIVEELKKYIPRVIEDEKERDALHSRFFEGYCIKKNIEDVPLSLHILSSDALDIISKCFVADIRVYRQTAKEESYNLNGFESNKYNYFIKNISLKDLKGVRTIVPISFINNDRYHLGIHRDKLLSSPAILHEKSQYISNQIDHLWNVVTENLYDESRRLYGRIDLEKMNVLNALAKKDKMSSKVKNSIKTKTEKYLSQIKEEFF